MNWITFGVMLAITVAAPLVGVAGSLVVIAAAVTKEDK